MRTLTLNIKHDNVVPGVSSILEFRVSDRPLVANALCGLGVHRRFFNPNSEFGY
jgi:hypothetical protein